MIKALNHTGFVVRDRDAAVAFYRDVVGLRVISEYGRKGPGVDQVVGYEGTELRSAVLDLGGGHILELIQYLSPAPAERPTEERNVLGAAHLAFEVEDIGETFRRLEGGGARVMNPPAPSMVCRNASRRPVPPSLSRPSRPAFVYFVRNRYFAMVSLLSGGG